MGDLQYRFKPMEVYVSGESRVWVYDIFCPSSVHGFDDLVEGTLGETITVREYIARQEPPPMSAWAEDSRIRAEKGTGYGLNECRFVSHGLPGAKG